MSRAEADTAAISVSPGETRVALLADGRLVEYLVDRRALGLGSRVGDIYLGRVTRTVDALAAAFVDIGNGPAGFLGLTDARPPGTAAADGQRITDFAAEGDAVVVQVTADAVAGKGPKLTARVTLPGRGVVYAPGQGEVRISRRIDGAAERQRLTGIVTDLAAPDEGFVLRTAAAGATAEALAAEVDRLRRLWAEVGATRTKARAPALLRLGEDAVERALQHWNAGLRRIVVDDRRLFAGLRDDDRVELHGGADDLFDAEGVAEQIDAALAPVVALPSGGSLIIEQTAALVAIDVNSGSSGNGGAARNAFAVNLEAVAEIARQLRLRDLAGQILVDLLPMRRRDQRGEVLTAMRAALADDPRPAHVIGYTGLGLLEMTRERHGPSLAATLLAACPACAGAPVASPLSLALEALRAVLRAVRGGAAIPALSAPPAVIEALRGTAAPALKETEDRLGGALSLRTDPGLAPEQYALAPNDGNEDRHGEG